MSKHEIEIEGLPEGYAPVSCKIDYEEGDETGLKFVMGKISVRRKVRKYDWGKTLDVVLTLRIGWEEVGMRHLHKQDAHYKIKLAEAWQPNIHGKCPVDPEASIVQVILADGTITERLADKLVWGKAFLKSTIVSWRFVRLADNVEW